jgi:2-methylcitrate dehydratase PrpD
MIADPLLTEQVAGFVVRASRGEMPDDVVDAAGLAIVDAVGVMLAGSNSEPGAVVSAYADRWASTSNGFWVASLPGPVVSAEVAAMINGTLGHALDYDDSIPGVGHPSVPILAAILATGQSIGRVLDGGALIEAFIIGVEVMSKVARALGVGHIFGGWHMTCTAGSMGAVAAASKIRQLDQKATVVALGVAGSLAGGLQQNFGTSVKPLHSGLAARNGVLAAELASIGATAAEDIFGGEGGFLRVYGGSTVSTDQLGKLGNPFALRDPGTALKKYPCCYVAARPIDAALWLRQVHGIRPVNVDKIVCRLPVGSMRPMMYHSPSDGMQAKFSMEYLLAKAILDGTVGLGSFGREAVMRPDVRELMQRVHIEEEARLRPDDPGGLASSPATGGHVEVVIRLDDGREVSRSEAEPHGGPRNPLSWDDIRRKFMACAKFSHIDSRAAEETLERLSNLDREMDFVGAVAGLSVAR